MASRKPKGIADDIVGGIRNIVSPWLGTPPGEYPQVTQFKQVTRVAAETLDQAFTGGMIKAGVQGNQALAKQAAVNAAALGTGYIAGKVVQKVVGKVAPSLMQDVGVHFSTNKNIKGKIKASPELRGTGKGPSTGAKGEIKVDVAPGKTYKFSGYGPTLGSRTKPGEMLPASKFQDFMSAQDTAYVTRSRLGRVDIENPALYHSPKIDEWYKLGGKYQSQRITGTQRVVEKVADYYDDRLANAVERARIQLEVERELARKASAVVAGLAPKKGRGNGAKKR